MKDIPSSPAQLSEEYLSQLVSEIDDDTVTAIILHGSYARGDVWPPYSDVDLVRILRETPERKQHKEFFWHNGYLLNLSSRPLSIYREWLTLPQEAIFRVSTIRDARILLDKENVFHAFKKEIQQWKWEPLQPAANAYVSQLLVELTEVVLRTLGALQRHDRVMLTERILLHILPTVTEAIAVQKGVLVQGNNYLRQVQETVGLNSLWTHNYMTAAGVSNETAHLTLEKRAIAALRLYQVTIELLKPSLLTKHKQTIEHLLKIVGRVLSEQIP